jgi:hypothetical protein
MFCLCLLTLSIPERDGLLSHLREHIKGSVRKDLQSLVGTSRPRGVLRVVCPGVVPAAICSLFAALLPPEFDDLALVQNRRMAFSFTESQFIQLLEPGAVAAPPWIVRAGEHGRHVWVGSYERRKLRATFSQGQPTPRLDHSACPRCTFVGELDGMHSTI